MKTGSARWLTLGVAPLVAACAGQTPVTTAGTTSTAGGDVSLDANGGGMWVDESGGMFMGGRRGTRMGLTGADIRAMSNANIVAHLATGDSPEVALSQAGAASAQNTAVRDDATRMVTEHTAHMPMGKPMATEGGITPALARNDTMDVMMASGNARRLSSATASAATDQQIMRAEVAMHRHMRMELTAIRPQASGAAAQLVDQTIPVVQQHLTEAQALLVLVGGNAGRGNGRGNGNSGMGRNNGGTRDPNGTTPSGSTIPSPRGTSPSGTTPGSTPPSPR